jgi:hypothetical protein
VIELEKTGFVLWEGITLLMVIFGGIGMVGLQAGVYIRGSPIVLWPLQSKGANPQAVA